MNCPLIRSIRVVVESEEPRVAFVNVRFKDEQEGRKSVYVEASEAMSNEEQRTYVLAEAIRYLEGARKRYVHLSELRGVFVALDVVKAKISS